MQDSAILDLGLEPRYAALAAPRPQRTRAVLAIVLGACVALLIAGFAAPGMISQAWSALGGNPSSVRISLDQLRAVSAMNVEDKSQLLAEGLDAQQRNAEIPVSALPLETVGALKWAMIDGSASATALRCLTQAVYYEAASEPIQGRRAVAQVVLNRMRHPAYPKSVCGVVYQGIERGWGCQFSFVCDGALLRVPSAALWREAHGVALAALGGHVEASVGTATHYHADYVLPKWAFNLAKIEQLGRHIFYRFNGNWGRTVAFTGRYSGIEQIPMINLAALRLKTGEPGELVGPVLLDNGLSVAPVVTDRHAPGDVGGRLDVSKQWRLAIPDPVSASSRYREAVEEHGKEAAAQAAPTGLAAAEPAEQTAAQ